MSDIQVEFEQEAAVSLLKDTFSGIDFGMALMDEDLNFVMFNEKYAELAFDEKVVPHIGDNAAELSIQQLEAGLYVLPEGSDARSMSQMLTSAVKTCQSDIALQRSDGRHLMASAKRTALGGYLVSVADVTASKQAADAEEARWTAVTSAIESLEEGVSIWDADNRFVMCNQKYVDYVLPFRGKPFEPGTTIADGGREIFRAGVLDLPEDADEDLMLADVEDWVRRFGEPREYHFKDGRILNMKVKPTELGGFLVTAVDVTEERNSEAKALELLSDAVQSLEEGFSLWDSDFNFVMCNDKYMEIVAPNLDSHFEVGRDAESIIAEAYHSGIYEIPDGVSENDWVSNYMDWARAHAGPIESRFKDGRVVIVSAKQTDLGGVLITAVDVTEERNSEAKARDMLLDAFQALDEGLVLCDENMNYIFGNDAWKNMMFTGRDQLIPKQGESVLENLVQHVQSGFYSIPSGMSREDYIAWMLGEMSQHGKQVPYSSSDGRHFVGSSHSTAFGGSLLFVRDVTKQQNAEENRLAAVNDALDAVDDPLALFSAGRRFVLGNKAWKDMVRGSGDPEPGDTADTLFARLLENDFYTLPKGMDREAFMKEGLRAMDDLETNYPFSLADGTQQLANVRKTGLDGFLISYRDVTEQLEMEGELEQQRETAHQNEKLSALGELLAGVAHELNNPLSVVFGYSQMLQGKIDDPVLSERVDLICQSSERAAKIVRTFLAMARQRPTKMQPCSVNAVIETALEVSSYSLKSSGTQVLVDLDPSDPHVTGDVDQLAQVFSNLLVNAGHAVGDRGENGRITLRSRMVGKKVRVEIEDNGHGIPEDIQSRIFEPFFTTKDVGQGTGIGLAFSHRIVESHGGRLSVKSKVGQGTNFAVDLTATSPSPLMVHLDKPRSLNGHSVLVVDDEDGVAQLITDMLTEEGFVVTKTTDPRTALRLAERGAYDTILSDFKMPQMNGEKFYEVLKAVSPESADRMGFITGDAMSADVVRFFKAARRPHIEKPIMKDELLALIQRASGEEVP